jgi:DNA polymerase-3 subunit gamma/tau
MTLAVDYRPKSFEDLCEQESIVNILQYQIDEDCPKNAYLFTGPAGCGKTTSARILANALNKGKGMPIEKDAARHNGVDKIRTIIDEAGFQSLDSKYKIFIIDEAHMITTEGWNAMLKILEEPPKNTIFIFCTTEPNKVPATILSRVQRFDFQRITLKTIIQRLKYILEQENLKDYDDEAIEFIARMANGGMRDAISLLEKCIDYQPKITVDSVIEALGYIDYDVLSDIVLALKNKEAGTVIEIIEKLYMSGVEIKFLVKQLLSFVLDLCTYSNLKNFNFINVPSAFKDKMDYLTDNCSSAPVELLKELIQLDGSLRYETNPKLLVESTMVVLCN